MTELTQEYLDKSLKDLLTKQDLKNFATKEDLKNLATKQDVQTIVDGAVDSLARMVKTGFDHVETTLAVLEQGQEDILLKLDNKVNKIDGSSFKSR